MPTRTRVHAANMYTYIRTCIYVAMLIRLYIYMIHIYNDSISVGMFLCVCAFFYGVVFFAKFNLPVHLSMVGGFAFEAFFSGPQII